MIKGFKERSKLIEKLKLLGLNKYQRKKLIRENCNCISRCLSFDKSLSIGVDSALKKRLRNNEAFQYLTEGQNQYNKLTHIELDRLGEIGMNYITNKNINQKINEAEEFYKTLKKLIYS